MCGKILLTTVTLGLVHLLLTFLEKINYLSNFMYWSLWRWELLKKMQLKFGTLLCILIHPIFWQKVSQNIWIWSNHPPFYQKFQKIWFTFFFLYFLNPWGKVMERSAKYFGEFCLTSWIFLVLVLLHASVKRCALFLPYAEFFSFLFQIEKFTTKAAELESEQRLLIVLFGCWGIYFDLFFFNYQ